MTSRSLGFNPPPTSRPEETDSISYYTDTNPWFQSASDLAAGGNYCRSGPLTWIGLFQSASDLAAGGNAVPHRRAEALARMAFQSASDLAAGGNTRSSAASSSTLSFQSASDLAAGGNDRYLKSQCVEIGVSIRLRPRGRRKPRRSVPPDRHRGVSIRLRPRGRRKRHMQRPACFS